MARQVVDLRVRRGARGVPVGTVLHPLATTAHAACTVTSSAHASATAAAATCATAASATAAFAAATFAATTVPAATDAATAGSAATHAASPEPAAAEAATAHSATAGTAASHSSTTLPSASHAATAHAAIPVAAAIASATITVASTVRAWLQEPAITTSSARLCEQHRSAGGLWPWDQARLRPLRLEVGPVVHDDGLRGGERHHRVEGRHLGLPRPERRADQRHGRVGRHAQLPDPDGPGGMARQVVDLPLGRGARCLRHGNVLLP